jgi:hypothetical protein
LLNGGRLGVLIVAYRLEKWSDESELLETFLPLLVFGFFFIFDFLGCIYQHSLGGKFCIHLLYLDSFCIGLVVRISLVAVDFVLKRGHF